METFISVSARNIQQYIGDYDVLVCSLRPSRRKAKQLAIAEFFFVLSPGSCIFITNGPLGDIKGLISFFVIKEYRSKLISRLRTIGFCNKFYMLNFGAEGHGTATELVSINEMVWKHIPFSIDKFYEQSKEVYAEHCAHNRKFHIAGIDGVIKSVKGYRGDGSKSGRRALPVEDARLMVNLSVPLKNNVLLDPFAGGGGILFEARYIEPSLELISIDIDTRLEPGLQAYADRHYGMDASCVKLLGKELDMIVTEIPFSQELTKKVVSVFQHLWQFLNENGRIVFMCAVDQYDELKLCMENLCLFLFIERRLNRKGTDVFISSWYKSGEQTNRYNEFFLAISKIY